MTQIKKEGFTDILEGRKIYSNLFIIMTEKA